MDKIEEQPSKWTIKKEISVPDIIALITAVAIPLGAYYTLDKRIALMELRQTENDSFKQEIKNDVKDIKTIVLEIYKNNLGNK